jgi:hypothetical protein
VKSILKIALGIIAALGGFLDIGDLVSTPRRGRYIATTCSGLAA